MWKLLMLMFCPAVTGEEDELSGIETETEGEETETESDETETDESESGSESEESRTERQPSRREKEIISLRERAQRAEDQHRAAMAELEAARRHQQGEAKPTDEQRLHEQEEAILRDPAATDWQRYSVQSARDARSARSESQNALRTAQDLADKAEFAALAALKPKTVEKYRDQVEEAKKRMPGAPRKELLAYIVGKAMLEGNVKTETKPTKPGGATRGKTPGARSDTTGTGRLTEEQKREKRLENVRF